MTTPNPVSLHGPWAHVALAVLLSLLVGCKDVPTSSGDATQVAARVNDQEISIPQWQHVVQRQARGANPRSDTLARQVLDVMVDQELAAQAAREQGLDRDPRVVQATEAAKREVLARAYQDLLAERAAYPTSDEVDDYYESNPALFAQRRFFLIQETVISGPEETLRALQPRVESAPNAAAANEAVRLSRLPSTVRRITVSPEDVPLVLLARLGRLDEGRSLLVPQPGGARVLTLLEAHPAPLSREAARASIQAFLTHEKRGQAVRDGLAELRREARVELNPQFAKAAASEAAASGSAPASR